MKEKKLKVQNIFILTSIVFILGCIINYGGRFIYFYLESKKDNKVKNFATMLKVNNMNNNNFKVISTSYYFMNNEKNNYVLYSGILWRIIKIDSDSKVHMIADKSVTSLAYGSDKNFLNSFVNIWLNGEKESLGILKKNIDISLLSNNSICVDIKDKVNNAECKNKKENVLISLLDMEDYINTGAKKSFVNTNENFYLINNNKENNIWYVDETSGLSNNDGTDIIGIKPVIALKSEIIVKNGKGTIEDPYYIEDNTYFGSYVKLGTDLWRVYDVDNDKLKLSLTSGIKVSNNELKYAYSNTNYKYDEKVKNTLAYYLNNTYLNTLSYKDIIIKDDYFNSYYSIKTEYDYRKIMNNKVSTKVGLLSIGNVMFNTDVNHSLATGTDKNGSLIYVKNKNATISYDDVSSKLSVIPCITIKKDVLANAKGTKENPYELR